MSFSFDPAQDEGLLRSLIDDKVQATAVFTDEELTAILDQNSSDVWAAAADCCRSLSAKYSKEAFVLGLGKNDIYLDRREKAKYYLQLATTYSSRSNTDIVEYTDHYNVNISLIGNDESEYIGDV